MRHILTVIAAVALLAVFARGVAADERSDGRALDRIFGSETLATNIVKLRQQVAPLDTDDRFDALAEYVLPSATHASIRFAAEFAPAPHRRELGAPVRRLQSAVFDLLKAAADAGKLDDLRARVAALTFEDEVEQRQRIALLALVEIARGDFDAASSLLDEMETRHRETTLPALFDRWPETLLLSVAVEHPQLHEPANAMLQTIIDGHLRPWRDAGPMYWDQHVLALAGRLRHVQHLTRASGTPAPFGTLPSLTHWFPVSEGDSVTYGQGFPTSHWQRFNDRIEKLAGHRDEHLYFRSPLLGNYEIECDITGFGWREGQLLIGGHWLWLQYTHREFETGDLRGKTGMTAFTPRQTQVDDWIHYRSVVKDGVCKSYVNGRLLLTEALRPTQFPWLALRAPYWSSTGFRDVRITGSPKIPESISMTADPRLSGWVHYHRDSVGGPNHDWHYNASLGPEGGIFARRKTEFAGQFQESLLRYHRPMLEDGVIEYEFYYQPGEFEVAPALDQQAFLIAPDGVRIHQITNGMWERAGRDPLNQSGGRPNASCPLNNGWNRLRFAVNGDVLSIDVNGQRVLERTLPADGHRTFGLFHYSDQTHVRVRNMRWTGNWPKLLPPLEEQELRDPRAEEIDAQAADLRDTVTFQFDASSNSRITGPRLSYSRQRFHFETADGKGGVTLRKNGLLMTRPSSGPYKDTWVAPQIQVEGDFDIVARFSDLTLTMPQKGDSTIYLLVVATDKLKTHSRVWHGLFVPEATDRRRNTQVEFNRFRPSGVEISFAGATAEECDSGRLRIVRIGRRMHFMIAEDDSPTFRLIHSQDVVADPLDPVVGVQLKAGTYDNGKTASGSVSVLWKSLTIRADRAVLTPSR